MLADLTRAGYLPKVWLASAYDTGICVSWSIIVKAWRIIAAR